MRFWNYVLVVGVFLILIVGCSKDIDDNSIKENNEVAGTFTDSRDGHVYKWIKIGNQTWMVENLAYLPSVSPSSSGSVYDPFYYVYDYQGTDVTVAKKNPNYTTYGVLYNWFAAKTASPSGWHLPTHAEWTELENYLIANGFNYDGSTTENKIAKSMATTSIWIESKITGSVGNNLSLNNKSGFTGLPSGVRANDRKFYGLESYGGWWSSTEYTPLTTKSWSLSFELYRVDFQNSDKDTGLSIRCVKD